jgi:hypothetical protein
VTVFSGLASKPVATVSPGFASKPVATVSRFGPQNWQLRFGDLSLKTTATVSWFWPRNQAGFGLSVAPQNRRGDAMAWDTCRDLVACLMCKQVWLGFSSLASRLAEARWRVVHVAPSQRLRQIQIEDGRINAMGCIGPCYLCFAIFILLGSRDIVVI